MLKDGMEKGIKENVREKHNYYLAAGNNHSAGNNANAYTNTYTDTYPNTYTNTNPSITTTNPTCKKSSPLLYGH